MEKQGSDVWIHCNHLHQWQRHCQLLILFALGTLVIGICYVAYMLTQTLYSMILFSFLHSGSTLVQVVIGTRWNDSDLDIICTDDAAPIVRSWLLGADVNQIFCGHTEVSLLKGMIPCLCISILLGVPWHIENKHLDLQVFHTSVKNGDKWFSNQSCWVLLQWWRGQHLSYHQKWQCI